MSMISYAQNNEDVMLWRALKHIENGFYIDVGANDPQENSVTKVFYDIGWHGINIEPLKKHFQDLSAARERDINLLAAAGKENGQIDIWECDVRGWATASPEVIAMHEANGHVGTFQKIPLYQLKEICGQYAKKDIHFLKIDVEGFEKEVIDGMDFGQYRPWIVVVEATLPNSRIESHLEWEKTLISNDYLLAYCDGLNRFYLAAERHNLMPSLRYPPNVLDGYSSFQLHKSELRAQQNEAKAQAQLQQALQLAQVAQQQMHTALTHAEHAKKLADSYLQDLQSKGDEIAKVQHELHNLQQTNHHHWQLAEQRQKHIQVIQRSWSWRLTWPVRLAGGMAMRPLATIRTIANQILAWGLNTFQTPLTKAMAWVLARPQLTSRISGWLMRWPNLHAHLLGKARQTSVLYSIFNGYAASNQDKNKYGDPSQPLAQLTPRARQIYADLKAAIAQQQKGGN